MNEVFEEFNCYLQQSDLWSCERPASCRWFLNLNEPCRDGGKFIIEISICTVMDAWIKKKMISRDFKSGDPFIALTTYAYDEKNNCYGRYNIQTAKDGKIDFDYIKMANLRNLKYLISSTLNLAYE